MTGKVIDGKIYKRHDYFLSKEEAERQIKALKKQKVCKSARKIKESGGYSVYIRK